MSQTSLIDREVGSRLTTKRVEVGLDRPAFAKTVGVLPEELANFESGDTRIDAYTMQKICSALGLSPLFFFELWLNKSDLSDGLPRLRRTGDRRDASSVDEIPKANRT